MDRPRVIRGAAITACAIGLPAALALAAATPTLRLLPATAVGRCANPPTRTVILSATVTPGRSGRASSGEAWFAFGSSAKYTMGSARVRVPWVSSTARPQSVTATVTPPGSGATHYALLAKGPHGATTRTADTILHAEAPPCPFPGGRKQSIPWKLIKLDNAHNTATIRYSLACGSSRTAVHVRSRSHGIVSIWVSTVVPEPAPECVVAPPPVTAVVHLPHTVTRAQLRHDPVSGR